MAKQFPAVLITGARQTGKTSLLRHLYPSASYLTLDLPANAEAARTAPDELLAAYPPPVIIDEFSTPRRYCGISRSGSTEIVRLADIC